MQQLSRMGNRLAGAMIYILVVRVVIEVDVIETGVLEEVRVVN